MPLRPRSAALTDTYRNAMVALRERSQRAAKQYWNAIDPDEIDATYQVVQLALEVQALQREGARLSSGYLLAFIEAERQEKISDPPIVSALMVGRSFSGMPLEEALRGPVLSTKVMIRDTDRPARECLNVFAAELEKQVGLAVDNVTRDSLRSGIDASPYCDGWIRAVRGTCAACAGQAEASRQPPGTPLQIHPNCQCVSEPTVKRKEPEWVTKGNESFQRDLREFGYSSDVGRNALHKFDETYGYDLMQTALRDPESLFDAVKAAYTGSSSQDYIGAWGRFGGVGVVTDEELMRVCVAVVEKVRWLEAYIQKEAFTVPEVLPESELLFRMTGMDHLPKSVLAKLEAGEQVTLSEPGFFATSPSKTLASFIAHNTSAGGSSRLCMWEVSGGKAISSPFVQAGEFIWPPGTRFTIKKIGENWKEWPRYKVVVKSD